MYLIPFLSHSASNNGMTSKSITVVQGHQIWYHSKAWVRFLIGIPMDSILTMTLSCISSEIKQDIGRKSQFFNCPLHSAPPLGDPRRNIAILFGVEKLEWCGYQMVKKVTSCLDAEGCMDSFLLI